jgi:hypothetical protein
MRRRTMRTLILAAAAVATLGVASAYADSEYGAPDPAWHTIPNAVAELPLDHTYVQGKPAAVASNQGSWQAQPTTTDQGGDMG